jgi:hypothetical protein
MTTPFTPPKFKGTGFNCPFCLAFAKQEWGPINKIVEGGNHGADWNYAIARCTHCQKFSVWVNERLVYPETTTVLPPNADLPADVQGDYDEARLIVSKSPRGAAALLRLCIQKVCKELGQPGKNINDDISALVKKGLPPLVQQALDIVRVVGNNAVHPGQIDLQDDMEIAQKLFSLVNLIADVLISQPKQVESLYASLIPIGQQDAIAKRDGKK